MKSNNENEYFFAVSIDGKAFTPSILIEKTNIPLTTFNNVGDKIIRKNTFIKIADYANGFYQRVVLPTENWNIIFNELLDNLTENYQIIKELGAEKIHIHVGITYYQQCNFELSLSEIKKLNNIDCTFSLSAYRE